MHVVEEDRPGSVIDFGGLDNLPVLQRPDRRDLQGHHPGNQNASRKEADCHGEDEQFSQIETVPQQVPDALNGMKRNSNKISHKAHNRLEIVAGRGVSSNATVRARDV